MTAFKEKAYAKINLHLDVVGKREDGFHDIKTVMHSVSLYDAITVTVAPAREISIRLFVEGAGFLPTDSKNLAYRAASLFLERLGVGADVKIKLVKRIPVSAGLAGGSSDAAAVLRALNRLYKRPFTTKALMKMGAELGSDVPYCIVGKTALCEGRGERVTKIDCSPSINVVIAGSDERVSTPEAYASLDADHNDFLNYDSEKNASLLESLIVDLKEDGSVKTHLFNVFESSVLKKCPKSVKLKELLLSLGAEASMMSGSGPAVFGVFETAEDAKSACEKLISLGYRAYYAKSV